MFHDTEIVPEALVSPGVHGLSLTALHDLSFECVDHRECPPSLSGRGPFAGFFLPCT